MPPTRVLIALLFTIQLVSMGAMEMSGPFWPVHLRQLTDSDTLFSFASVAVYVGPMLGILLTSAFWGRIGDRYGHKLMMIRALAGLTLTQLGLALFSDLWTILVLRFLQGACAGYIAPAQAYGVSIEVPSRRARLFALLQISTNVGSLLGAVVGGLILDHATFFWINLSAAALCAVCTVIAALTLPNVPPVKKTTAPSTGGTWQASALLPLLTVMGILLLARMLPQTSFALYVSTTFAVSNALVGLCYGLLALGFILSATAWARQFEGRSQADSLRRLTWVVAGCIALTALAGLTRNPLVFVLAYFVWGVLLGATTPVLMALVSRTADSTQQGHVLGIAQGTAQFASIVGICAGGLLSQVYGLAYTYLFVCVAYAMALIAILALRNRWVCT
ncbi:MAG: MFS transporter [Pseudomonadales bacterium RIFCSPLOWO2_12_60_38]|jgi:MFS transporter, DHA1 family, staphyloferrin B biosynthesis exporter|uniref:MFS transporter n=1 Tax=Pseudomonas TaxID=286 RepID=UPI0003DD705D|nr:MULTISPECIES: MFS transporter [unclassified Pseudomonas]ETK39763.1 MFS transporter [Pseudomonas fluorescens FH5]MBJ2236435.1 MFS transporter [Pseudomonas fluorescens]OHC34771.1 MAG: MFS transporter [Pseudomonadales bacterium RIFCSPLOWO2_12_60_38]OHC38646.1 MAG: MFS transporter [Pseudomonadales bacterium RIFCSPLOWO2_12_FULL_59_450]MBS6083468.1 MFS transporter [Pseudomonas fluorescens]